MFDRRARARAALVGLLACGVMGTGSDALAGPSPKLRRAPAKLAAATKKLALKGFKDGDTVTNERGQKIKVKDYMEAVNRLQALAEAAGGAIDDGKDDTFEFELDSTVPVAFLEKQAQAVTKAVGAKQKRKKKTKKKSNELREPNDTLSFDTGKETFGNQKIAAIYFQAGFATDGDSRHAKCGGSMGAGVYVFGTSQEVAGFSSSVSIREDATAHSEFLLFGKQLVWSKDSRGKANVKKTASITVGPPPMVLIPLLVSATLKVTLEATASIDVDLAANKSKDGLSCSADVTPGILVSASAKAEVNLFGYGEASAGGVGVEGKLALLDLSVPTHVSFETTDLPKQTRFKQSLSSTAKLEALDGSLSVYFTTRIPIGEKVWDWDKDKFKIRIASLEGINKTIKLYDDDYTHAVD